MRALSSAGSLRIGQGPEIEGEVGGQEWSECFHGVPTGG